MSRIVLMHILIYSPLRLKEPLRIAERLVKKKKKRKNKTKNSKFHLVYYWPEF